MPLNSKGAQCVMGETWHCNEICRIIGAHDKMADVQQTAIS